MPDFFEDIYEPDDEDFEGYERAIESQKRTRERIKQKSAQNEVGKAPTITDEMLSERKRFHNDFVALHEELFPNSTGIKPFGEVQKESIRFGRDIFDHGGRLIKLEPRGFAKTTRIANEALAAILLGMQDYILIVCSNVQKAEEILDAIKTELYNNDELLKLFPGPIACFRHLDDTPQKARYQTYDGVQTYIRWGSKGLRFPYVPGEPSSGRYIEVRPLANLKGLFHKVKAGPDAGKIFRPTLVIFDDPQTSSEARSEPDVRTIIIRIKRDALKGGSHGKPVSAIMAITPVCIGDVAYHFEKNEHSWDLIKYKMLEKWPDAHEKWMTDYAAIYSNYDRTKRGDRIRAKKEARKYVEENWDELHEGAEATWDHAFAWEEVPQTEISPIQHAYNIILDDGMEDFEYEYQCNTEYGEYDDQLKIHAPPEQILTKILPLPPRKIPQSTKKLVTHIDVNKEILTYVVAATDDPVQVHITDYGTYPDQPSLWSKKNVVVPLRGLYPQISDYREVLYLATKDLIEYLARRHYVREDGVTKTIDTIGIDFRYEENYILRACRESPYRNIVVPCGGVYISPDDSLIHDKNHPPGTKVWRNCKESPYKDKTIDIFEFDSDFFKTELHRGFNLPLGVKGSCSLFEVPVIERHKQFADHCNSEAPEITQGKKTVKTKIHWRERSSYVDNEFFDNSAACLSLFTRAGIKTHIDRDLPEEKPKKRRNMQEWMDQQRHRKLLKQN